MSRQFRAISIDVRKGPFVAKGHDGSDYTPDELKEKNLLIIARDKKGDLFYYDGPIDYDLEAATDPRSWPKRLFRDYWRYLCGPYTFAAQLSPHQQAYLSGSVTRVVGI